jgi:hypothetical protein
VPQRFLKRFANLATEIAQLRRKVNLRSGKPQGLSPHTVAAYAVLPGRNAKASRNWTDTPRPTKPNPISLSDDQLQTVMRATEVLDPTVARHILASRFNRPSSAFDAATAYRHGHGSFSRSQR